MTTTPGLVGESFGGRVKDLSAKTKQKTVHLTMLVKKKTKKTNKKEEMT